MKFFKVDSNLTKKQCEVLLESLSSVEIEELESLDIISDDIEYDGLITSYIICNDYTITKVESFLTRKNVNYNLKDISIDILVGKISLKNTTFEKQTDKFIEEFLTVDIVLDKINESGVESLTEIDKKWLKSSDNIITSTWTKLMKSVR